MKKHIVCFGDSNTHGYCADPADCADGGDRFNESERWPCLLQNLLGDEYHVIEEGLSGRTSVFDDPIHGGLAGIDYIGPCLMSHEPVDLLIIMLGTNDTKERFGLTAKLIGIAMQRLIRQARSTLCWGGKEPNILLVCPPPIGEQLNDPGMGNGCAAKSKELPPHYAETAALTGAHFMDAADCEFNKIDFMHLTRAGHDRLAHKIAAYFGMAIEEVFLFEEEIK